MTLQMGPELTTRNRVRSDARARSRWGDFPPPPPVRSAPRPLPLASGPLERAAAVAMLISLLPLCAAIALAIKIESPRGPVLYRQERVGIDRRRDSRPRSASEDRRKTRGFGRIFQIYKFRTMVTNAEALTGPVWAAARDPRITRVGRVLRQLRLDELPQLYNVASGEMSLIGPRPERPHFVEKFTNEMPSYERRLRVPPGITGLAQVERRYDENLSDVRTKLQYDLFYVTHRSTMMNLKILIKTVDVVLRGRGAR